MTFTLKTPDAPATSKQLWLLHKLTHSDTRGLKLTMAEASERIDGLMQASKQATAKPTRPTRPITPDTPTTHFQQGMIPDGKPDMATIQADFKANAYEQGRTRAGNDHAKIDFCEWECSACYLGAAGKCSPDWDTIGAMSSGGVVEEVTFSCKMHEPIEHSLSQYCQRPRGKQCQRKHLPNPCLECGYRTNRFQSAYNRHASATYVPTLQKRIEAAVEYLDLFKDIGSEYRARGERKLALLQAIADEGKLA